jgi:hypothetical protein
MHGHAYLVTTKALVLSIAVLIATGCATAPCTAGSARPLPPQRITSLPSASNPSIAARIIIVRDKGYAGSMATMNLRLDGKPVASFHPCETLRFTLNPGDYVLGVKPVPDLGTGIIELGFTAKAGEQYGFRIGSTVSGFVLQRSYEVIR